MSLKLVVSNSGPIPTPKDAEAVRLVMIEPPYETLSLNEGRDYFTRGLLMKLQSYQQIYAPGVLPLDTYDFISTHFLIGVDRPDGFAPMMVFRTTSWEACLRHNLPFTGVAVVRSSGAEAHARRVEEMLAQWKAENRKVFYGSGFAISPESRKLDPEVRALMKDLMISTLARYEIEQGSYTRLACAVLKVHTDQLFATIGYRRICDAKGEPLPPFQQASILGERAVLVECPVFTDEAMGLVAKHEGVWNRREIVSVAKMPENLRKAA